MEQNNSNIPIVKIGDTIYDSSGSYGALLVKRKVERITKTQIILDEGTKLRNNPSRMYGDEEAYCLSAVGRTAWISSNYYLETERLITRYKQEQLFLETKKEIGSLDLKKLDADQLNMLLSTISQIKLSKKNQDKLINKENQ